MKYEKEFPLFSTKGAGVTKKYNLSDINERKEYFEAKAGDDIEKLRKFFDEGKTFIVYLLGKKNAGKGTYTKLLMEIFGTGQNRASFSRRHCARASQGGRGRKL